jgi:hypothetical protein
MTSDEDKPHVPDMTVDSARNGTAGAAPAAGVMGGGAALEAGPVRRAGR